MDKKDKYGILMFVFLILGSTTQFMNLAGYTFASQFTIIFGAATGYMVKMTKDAGD